MSIFEESARKEMQKSLEDTLHKTGISDFAKEQGVSGRDVYAIIEALRNNGDEDSKNFWKKAFNEILEEKDSAAAKPFWDAFFKDITELAKITKKFAEDNKFILADVTHAIDSMRVDPNWNFKDHTATPIDKKFLEAIKQARDYNENAAIVKFAQEHGVSVADVQADITTKRDAGAGAISTFWKQPFDKILEIHAKEPAKAVAFDAFLVSIDTRAASVKKFADENKHADGSKIEVSDVNDAISRMRAADPKWDFMSHKEDLDAYGKLDAAAKEEANKKDANNKKFFEEVEAARVARLNPEQKTSDKADEKEEGIGSGTKGQTPAKYSFWNFDITYAGNHSIMGQMINAFSQLMGNWAMSYAWMALAQVYTAAMTEVSGAAGFVIGWGIRPFFREQSNIMLARAYDDSGTLPWFLSMGKYALGFVTNNGELKAEAMKDAHNNFYNSFWAKGANLCGPLVGQIATSIPAKLTAGFGYMFRGDPAGVINSWGGILTAKGDADTSPGLGRIFWDARKDPLAYIPGLSLFAGTCTMSKGVDSGLFGNQKLGKAGLYTSYYGVNSKDELLACGFAAPAPLDMLTYARPNVPSNEAKSSKSWTLGKGKALWNYITGKKETTVIPAENTSAITQNKGEISAGVTTELSEERPKETARSTGRVIAELSDAPETGPTPTARLDKAPTETRDPRAEVSTPPVDRSSSDRLSKVSSSWQKTSSLRSRLPRFAPISGMKYYYNQMYCVRKAGIFEATQDKVELQQKGGGGPNASRTSMDV